ncbi:hypothetical protein LASUN_10420 [Lentilactobacillus sunkii]|jgi:hypothetical protein|uniref:Uncharacterized protein n=1 Tax=Lentilactobacillus sunkii TaxID=481719 RepID=A0A1E7XE91_9LACO|nr:hypothetical protein [Lentilactobacillus sunkii]OFA11433.1 hypothetical protein LASUN_10420 [Lentilactobacillus sunkii]
MKKRKILLGTVALSLGLLFAVGSSNNVNAATWHKGTPRVLHGYWYNKQDKLLITNKSVYIIPKTGASVSRVKSVKYRYLGHRTYQYHQKFDPNGSYTGKITISANHRYVKFAGVSGLFSRN